MNRKYFIPALIVCYSFNALASDFNIPNIFIANQPAVASEVNGNFGAAKSSIDNNNSRIASLEATVISLQNTINSMNSRLTAVENNTVLELNGLLMYSEINGYPTAEFRAINIQVNNGLFSNGTNGLGNIIIGYNEPSSVATLFCSDGQYTDSVNCIGNGHIWDRNIRTGSHNLILGTGNSYDAYGSIVSGIFNVVNAGLSVVVSGRRNITNDLGTVILSGVENEAYGEYSSISGGYRNMTTGFQSNVSGGKDNIAGGIYSNVSGGLSKNAPGVYDWAAGSLFQDQ